MNSFPADPDKAAVIIHSEKDQNKTYTWRDLQRNYRNELSINADDNTKAISTEFPEQYHCLRITNCRSLQTIFIRGELRILVVENCPNLDLLSLPSSLRVVVLQLLPALQTLPTLPPLERMDFDTDLFVRFIAQLKDKIAPEVLVNSIVNTVDPEQCLQMISAYGKHEYECDFRAIYGDRYKTLWRH